MSREGIPILVIQRQLGHADLAVTSAYLRGIDNAEIIHTVHELPARMIRERRNPDAPLAPRSPGRGQRTDIRGQTCPAGDRAAAEAVACSTMAPQPKQSSALTAVATWAQARGRP